MSKENGAPCKEKSTTQRSKKMSSRKRRESTTNYESPSTGLWHQEMVAVIDGLLWEFAVKSLGGCKLIDNMGMFL